MKKLIILWTSGCVLCLFLSTSCNRSGLAGNAVHFDSIQIAETYYLFQDTANPGCNLQISFIYPDSACKQTLTLLQGIFIEKIFGNSFKNQMPKDALEAYVQHYIQDFKQFELPEESGFLLENDSLADEMNGGTQYKDEGGFFYYSTLSNRVVYNQNNFISFIVKNIAYEGGAHSSQSLYGYVIDLKNKRLLQEEDFAGINYKQNIAQVLINKIVETNNLKNPEDLENLGYFSVEEIVPNNNFTIDNKGLTYYFNENEIAGTMVGLTSVFIPYEEMNVYLKEGSPIASLSR
jgi:hypothetical protein